GSERIPIAKPRNHTSCSRLSSHWGRRRHTSNRKRRSPTPKPQGTPLTTSQQSDIPVRTPNPQANPNPQRMATNDPYLTDHFHPLRLASTEILSALRDDESSPHGDLYRRLVCSTTTTTTAGDASRYHSSAEGGEGTIKSVTAPVVGARGDASRVVPPSNYLLHSHSVPLPPPVAAAMQNAKVSSCMGLFSEANLVWVVCDSVLFLWRHASGVVGGGSGNESDAAAGRAASWGGVPSLPRQVLSEDLCSFSVPSGQCIVGVGLVRPKRGVFKESVEWCIIVSTPAEVILCALDRQYPSHDDEMDTNTSMLRLVPTRFILPTDNVPMISIRGTKNGRIFMGGYDGCLYEMCYEGVSERRCTVASSSPEEIEAAIDNYFDGDGELVADLPLSQSGVGTVLSGGKRVLSALTFGTGDTDVHDQHRRRKCSKINHSSVSPGIASVVPGVVVRAAVSMFGSSIEAAARKGGPIVSLVLDEERLCLYTLGASGIICAYDMIDSSKSTGMNSSPRLACVLDSVETAKLYLDLVARGRMVPRALSESIELGTITFPGGIASAQAGVGGMEGARDILKRHDQETSTMKNTVSTKKLNPREITNCAGILHPVSIHLVPGIESKSLTLVAVTGGGLRYYLSSLSSSYMSSAQASQGPFDYGTRGNDSQTARTRPSKKMTFCHIRAPPPYSSSDGNDGLKIEVAPSAMHLFNPGSGIPPGIHNTQITRGASSDSRKGDVVKSYYGKGIFVLALDLEKRIDKRTNNITGRGFFSTESEGSNTSKPFAGNAVIVALPDSASRMSVTTSITVKGSDPSSQSTSGGISEIVILPMSGIGGTNSPVLPGGTTFDMSSQNNGQSSVVRLFMNSETPSDSELQIGLIPSFIPPKVKVRKTNLSPGASSAIAVPNGQGRGVISAALLSLSNYVRSGQGSGCMVGTVSDTSGGVRPLATFRVSRRHGCDVVGFSSSSAEVRGSSRARTSLSGNSTPKSARLPPWLMTPAAAPMNFQSSMHLMPPGSESLLILNAGGLHFFTNSSLLNNLASVLLRASNVAKDDAVRNFFTSYGYAEGCAMCFALATSSSSNSNLRSKAEQAALTHARLPSMTLFGSGNGRDPLSAYKFQPSSLYEGLVKFSSRLLRPFWLKIAVVVTEGRPIQSTTSVYSSYYALVPAKVELLLDDVTLDEIRRPLLLLQALMKETFVPVVHSVPGYASNSHTESMDVDDDMDTGGRITRALQSQSRAAQKVNDSNQTHDLTPDELRKVAYQKEDRNMHSLYRLWSRCVQMLNLMSCLKRAHASPALPDVQWGLLHGLTFCQLVTSREGQQRIETLLNSLFSQSENSLVSGLSTEGDSLADTLSRQCYLFFSSASRLTYLGFKFARVALARSTVLSQRNVLANKAASYLRAAARHWHDPASIVGRLVAKNASSSWQDIAKSAIDGESPLALAADELMKLENAEGLVDVCLICAANFGGAKVQRDDSKELGETPVEGMFDWERGLYHQPPSEQPGDTESSTQSIVSDMQATSSDALKACHSILFFYIAKLLGEGGVVNQRLAEELVGACASSTDVKFLRSLYDQLVSTHNVDTLLRIDSSTLEDWLKEKNDSNLVWKYYSFHGRNVLAGDEMWKVALDKTEKIPLVQRVECLTRASNSFSAALQTPVATEEVSAQDLQGRILQITEQLDVAAIQQRVLAIAERSENTHLDSAKMDALSFSLVNVSDLYNEYAGPLNLFDICLLIMETCRRNNPIEIKTLWKSIFCEEILPCGTNSRVAFEYLNELKDGSLVQEDIIFGKNNDDTIHQFENGSWVSRLKARVTDLGRSLYGKGADYTFPLDLLLETLEGLRQAYTNARNGDEVSHPWPAKIMLDVGVPYVAVLEAYEAFGLQGRGVVGGDDSKSRYDHFIWTSELLELWVAAALSDDDFSRERNTNNASYQLVRAVNQGRLLLRIDSLKSALEGTIKIDSELAERVHSRLTDVQDVIARNFR
ncbi:hypothetical protein HJC23_002465, partial [Cyclotella cryptica]